MSSTPAVSVIMPTYQRGHLISRALRSVLDQDFEDLEIIVVDDGSTDHTASVVGAFPDSRLRALRFESNRGIGAARSAGVASARGEIVAFLDSDDVWKPGKLKEVLHFLGRHRDVEVTFSNFDNVNHTHGVTEQSFEQNAAILRRLEVSPREPGWWIIDGGLLEILLEANIIGTSSVVVLRRSVFRRAGNFREDLSGPEDLEMWWRAALKGCRFAYTESVLVERNKDEGSVTARTRAFVPRYLRAVDACEATARAAGRDDLMAHLRQARARACRSLIDACGVEGRRGEAVRAFLQSLPHGSRLEAVRELAVALAGPRAVAWLRRLRTRSAAAARA